MNFALNFALLSQIVGVLAGFGVLSWVLLIVVDSVVGAIRRTSAEAPTPGKFSFSFFLGAMIHSNLATNDAALMGGTVVFAFVSALLAYLAKTPQVDMAGLVFGFKLAVLAAGAAFSTLAAKQDVDLLNDIRDKLFSKIATT